MLQQEGKLGEDLRALAEYSEMRREQAKLVKAAEIVEIKQIPEQQMSKRQILEWERREQEQRKRREREQRKRRTKRIKDDRMRGEIETEAGRRRSNE